MPLLRAEFRRYRHLLRPPLLHDISQVGYWPFNYDDGNYARDRSGYDNHGTVYGAQRVAGKIGDALSFDGVDDCVAVPHSPSTDLKTALTLTTWLYRTRLTTEWIFSKNYEGLADTQYGFYISWDNYIYFILEGGTRVSYYIDTVGRWAHIACTWDGLTARIFVDGTLRNSASYSAVLTTRPYALTLACRKTTGGIPGVYWFKGIIDEARIFNRALSQAEIARLMNMRGI